MILTTRDPDTWDESVKTTIYEMHRATEGARMGFLRITGQFRMAKTMSRILNHAPEGTLNQGNCNFTLIFVKLFSA